MKDTVFGSTIIKLCIAAVIGWFLSSFIENPFLIPTAVMIVGIALIVEEIHNIKNG